VSWSCTSCRPGLDRHRRRDGRRHLHRPPRRGRQHQGARYRALELFAVWPLFTTGLVCLASGIVLGIGTKWGLVRYSWVAIKLVLNIVLTALVLVALRPGVIEAAEQGRRFAAGEPASLAVGDLIFAPIVSPTFLLIAFVLAVLKPWGRIRKRPAPREDER
jgi:hypothetical protein